jgi:membrane-associated phospholipid phosphatase
LKRYIIVFSFFVSFAVSALSAELDSILWHDIKSIGNDYVRIGKSLCSNSANELYYIGGSALISLAAMSADQQVQDFSLRNTSKFTSDYIDFVDNYGLKTSAAVFSGGTYLYGLIAGDEYVRVTGRMVGESILLAGAVTGSLKIILGRARPTNQDDNYNFQYFEFDDDFNSFPSGHTTIAFAISSVIAGRIDRWWAYVGAYGLSASTAYARMYKNRHWFSDVVLGAAIGTLSGLAVLNAQEKPDNSNFSWYLSPGGAGVMYRF